MTVVSHCDSDPYRRLDKLNGLFHTFVLPSLKTAITADSLEHIMIKVVIEGEHCARTCTNTHFVYQNQDAHTFGRKVKTAPL